MIAPGERPAVLGGRPIRESFLPLAIPDLGPGEYEAVNAAMASGWLSTGPKVKEWEQALADYVGSKHAVALASCTAGLHLALVAAGIGPGDEVIVPSITFAATANVVEHVGAKPVFADIDLATANITAETIEPHITERTRAIIAVHFAGLSLDLGPIDALAEKHGLLVIEDSAHAIGTEVDGVRVGAAPHRVAVFSFYATKTMTTGEGGMLVTGRDDLVEKVRLLSIHGITKDAWKRYSASGSWKYDVLLPGYKAHTTDPAAAMGIVQLGRLDSFIEKREALCQQYDAGFAGLDAIITPSGPPANQRHSRYIYPIRVRPGSMSIGRDELVEALRAENIGTGVHFLPIHMQPFYRDTYGYSKGMLPATDEYGDTVVSIPLFPKMTESDVDDVIAAIRRIVSAHRA